MVFSVANFVIKNSKLLKILEPTTFGHFGFLDLASTSNIWIGTSIESVQNLRELSTNVILNFTILHETYTLWMTIFLDFRDNEWKPSKFSHNFTWNR